MECRINGRRAGRHAEHVAHLREIDFTKGRSSRGRHGLGAAARVAGRRAAVVQRTVPPGAPVAAGGRRAGPAAGGVRRDHRLPRARRPDPRRPCGDRADPDVLLRRALHPARPEVPSWPEILEIHRITGDACSMLKVAAELDRRLRGGSSTGSPRTGSPPARWSSPRPLSWRPVTPLPTTPPGRAVCRPAPLSPAVPSAAPWRARRAGDRSRAVATGPAGKQFPHPVPRSHRVRGGDHAWSRCSTLPRRLGGAAALAAWSGRSSCSRPGPRGPPRTPSSR